MLRAAHSDNKTQIIDFNKLIFLFTESFKTPTFTFYFSNRT